MLALVAVALVCQPHSYESVQGTEVVVYRLAMQALNEGRMADALSLLGDLESDAAQARVAMIVWKPSDYLKAHGIIAYNRRQAEAIIKKVRPRLEEVAEDDAEAASILGSVYRWGITVEPDLKRSLAYSLSAARKGHSLAMGNVGFMLRDGIGTKADPARAFACFQRAYEAGDLISARALAEYYEVGRGIPKDQAKATKLRTEAAEKGCIDAMVDLVELYADRASEAIEAGDDEAARKYFTVALQWRKKAADGGYLPFLSPLDPDSPFRFDPDDIGFDVGDTPFGGKPIQEDPTGEN